MAQRLALKPEGLEGQDSWACAASAALVWATGQDEPVTAALRIVDTLRETLEEDEPERVAALGPLREQLAVLHAESPRQSLLDLWLQRVEKDYERLHPLQDQMDLGLLVRRSLAESSKELVALRRDLLELVERSLARSAGVELAHAAAWSCQLFNSHGQLSVRQTGTHGA